MTWTVGWKWAQIIIMNIFSDWVLGKWIPYTVSAAPREGADVLFFFGQACRFWMLGLIKVMGAEIFFLRRLCAFSLHQSGFHYQLLFMACYQEEFIASLDDNNKWLKWWHRLKMSNSNFKQHHYLCISFSHSKLSLNNKGRIQVFPRRLWESF